MFLGDYSARCDAYVNAMKEMFKQTPLTMKKSLTLKQKFQKIMTDIGGGWYMGESSKGLPPLRRTKLSKKHKKSRMKFRNIYMKLISSGMIGNSNFIGTNLNGWIQNLSTKGINPIQFLQKKPR